VHRNLQRRQRLLLRPLPYAGADHLTIVWGELCARNVNDWPFSPPDFRDLRLQSTAIFEDMAGIIPTGRTPLSDGSGEPEQIRQAVATPNVFALLGARILLGRDFATQRVQEHKNKFSLRPLPPLRSLRPTDTSR
jgi:hypothetical protein